MNMHWLTGFLAHGYALAHWLTVSVQGNAARANLLLARWTSIAAALEFLLIPCFGWLSDSRGRKPLLLCTPALNVLLRTAVATWPKPW